MTVGFHQTIMCETLDYFTPSLGIAKSLLQIVIVVEFFDIAAYVIGGKGHMYLLRNFFELQLSCCIVLISHRAWYKPAVSQNKLITFMAFID